MSPMRRSSFRLLLLIVGLAVSVLASGLVYRAGMEHLEGDPRTFWESLSWAAETITTTGYGEDGRWENPLMVVYVTLVQFFGVFLIFLVFPIYLIPFLEERFQVRLPREDRKIEDHVLVFGFGPPVETLIDELGRSGVPTLVIEGSEEQARRLVDDGYRIVHRHLEDGALEAASLESARALIANGRDDENANLIVSARQLGFEGDILALVEEPYHRRPLKLAGATAVYTPRHILGAALAARASRRISPRLEGFEQLSSVLQVQEVRLQPHSALVGKTLEQASIGAETGATVIGQWYEGALETPATPKMELLARGILVVVGSEESIDRLADLASGTHPLPSEGAYLVAGYGEVGRKVVQLLRDADEEVLVIDREPHDGVDLVGDVLDAEVLEQANLDAAQAIILALDSDSATLFATVLLKQAAPELPIIARVNRSANVSRIHRVGAEFALSISQVSGQMLARRLLGEQAVEVNARLKVLKASGEPLEGRHPSELKLRRRTGCSVVAVEREGEVVVRFDDDFRFTRDDTVYVAGSLEDIPRYRETFGG